MHSRFEKLVYDLSREVEHLSARAIEAHPAGDPCRWNTRQIVEHLVLTYRVSGANLQDRLKKGRPTKYRPTLAQISTRLVLLKLGYFPPGRPAPAAVVPPTEPAETMDGTRLVALFGAELQAVDGILDTCQAHFGRSALATHQVLGPLSVEDWRRFHVVHARHHFDHIRRLNQQNRQFTAKI